MDDNYLGKVTDIGGKYWSKIADMDGKYWIGVKAEFKISFLYFYSAGTVA